MRAEKNVWILVGGQWKCQQRFGYLTTYPSLVWKVRPCHPPTAPGKQKTLQEERSSIYISCVRMDTHGHVMKPFPFPRWKSFSYSCSSTYTPYYNIGYDKAQPGQVLCGCRLQRLILPAGLITFPPRRKLSNRWVKPRIYVLADTVKDLS